MIYINNEKQIEGKLKKNFAKEEIIERRFRADPLDGLRPIKIYREKS